VSGEHRLVWRCAAGLGLVVAGLGTGCHRYEGRLVHEAVSFDGRPLVASPMPPEVAARRGAELDTARAELARKPDDPDALIWVGRRLAYLGRFREAIEAFSKGVERFPQDARFLRHRGHRWITLRQLDKAIADLERAVELMRGRPDEVEPDGQPNARNVPTGTLHFNVFYHLALACYLKRDFAGAATAWAQCHEVSKNPDTLCATTYWRCLTLRRLGRAEEAKALLAPIRPDLDVIENHAYHRLLLAFAAGDASQSLLDGKSEVDLATLGNGVATWLHLEGQPARARALWRRVVESTPWPAFGHLAAEAELLR
jgi:tetratricopeptide (TPR) repeat protein